MAKKLGLWKKIRIGLMLITEIMMIKSMWMFYEPTLKEYRDDLKAKAEADPRLNELYFAIERIIELTKQL